MIHIFCSPEDEAAVWLAEELRERGSSVTVSLPEELVINSRLSLEIGNDFLRPSVILASGITITPEKSTAIIIRMTQFPLPALTGASDNDLVYASEEVRATLVGWFSAWKCMTIGRPDPYTPWGDGASEDEWRIMAMNSNISIASQNGEKNRAFDLLVTSSEVYASDERELEPATVDAARILFTLQSDAVAAFRFRQEAKGAAFERLIPMPDFRIFGSFLPNMLAAEATI